jgi:hypothetical protein
MKGDPLRGFSRRETIPTGTKQKIQANIAWIFCLRLINK